MYHAEATVGSTRISTFLVVTRTAQNSFMDNQEEGRLRHKGEMLGKSEDFGMENEGVKRTTFISKLSKFLTVVEEGVSAPFFENRFSRVPNLLCVCSCKREPSRSSVRCQRRSYRLRGYQPFT